MMDLNGCPQMKAKVIKWKVRHVQGSAKFFNAGPAEKT